MENISGWKLNLYIQKCHRRNRFLLIYIKFRYQEKDGWAPLCEFLNKEIPNYPIPHDNRTFTNFSEVNQDHIIANTIELIEMNFFCLVNWSFSGKFKSDNYDLYQIPGERRASSSKSTSVNLVKFILKFDYSTFKTRIKVASQKFWKF